MSKNKGGREARKPKKAKAPKTAAAPTQLAKVELAAKPRQPR